MPRTSRRDLARLALLGVLGNTLYQMIFIQGIAHQGRDPWIVPIGRFESDGVARPLAETANNR